MHASAYRALIEQIAQMMLIVAATLVLQPDVADIVLGIDVLIFGVVCLISGRYLDNLLSRTLTLSMQHESLLQDAEVAKENAERAYERYQHVQEAARMEQEQRAREAESADCDKTRFIARASHDLRQPMSELQNVLEVARHWLGKGD